MDYIALLNLKKEPFSISPDPNFFYHSKDYQECLQKLELSIRLRRGLNIILGDVGTGKTTLSRTLIQLFQGYEEFRFHLILDPSFNSEYEFLLALVKIFNIPLPADRTCLAFKEAIRTSLLKEGLEKKKIIVLIIDETQKMDYPFLELLRDFLNFETNEYKLLQLVLLGQLEFLEKIQGKKNFMDRVNMMYFLKPLNRVDTREMIEFRLRKAGYFPHQPLFTKDAYQKIFHYSQGYPRKIVNICHHCLLMMLIKKKYRVDDQIVKLVVKSLFPDAIFPEKSRLINFFTKHKKLAGALAAILLFISGSVGIFHYNRGSNRTKLSKKNAQPQTLATTANTSSGGKKTAPQKMPIKNSKLANRNDFFPPSSPIRKVREKSSTEQDAPKKITTHLTSLSKGGNKVSKKKAVGYEVIVAEKGDFISRMALRLYGHEITDEMLASIRKANPHISNLDFIEPGQKVYFPVLNDKKGLRKKTDSYIYGVQVDYFSTVAGAQDCIKRLSQIGSRIYIEKEDFSDQGEKYAVIIGPFGKIAEAWDIIDKLKKKNLNNSRVVVISQN